MAVYRKSMSEMTPEESANFNRSLLKYSERILNPPSELLQEIPIIGRWVDRYSQAQYMEAAFFLLKSGDPVIDQKMLNAIKIKDYEMKFGLWTSAIWGSIFAALPGLKGFSGTTRLLFFAVPFSLAYYRSFRRGYDQIIYVGSTYLELIARQRVLFKYLGETEGYLSEFKEEFMKTRDYKLKLELFGIKPYEDN